MPFFCFYISFFCRNFAVEPAYGNLLIYNIMTINNIQDEIIEEFDGIDDWMDRYAYIIELGATLPPFPDADKTPENLIEGCQSRVWIAANLDDDGTINFRADSDALIVKGIVALLLRVVNHHTPKEILDADLYFINKIGLSEHLSPTRSNGLVAMVRQMRNYAQAFALLEDRKGK